MTRRSMRVPCPFPLLKELPVNRRYDRNLLLALAFSGLGCLTLAGCGAAPGRHPNAHQQFEAIRLKVIHGDYQASITELRAFLKDHPGSKDASRASFFIAKAWIGLGKLDEASRQFQATIASYPESEEAHKSRYKLAMIDLWQGRSAQALDAFETLAANPSGPLAPEAAGFAAYLKQRPQPPAEADLPQNAKEP